MFSLATMTTRFVSPHRYGAYFRVQEQNYKFHKQARCETYHRLITYTLNDTSSDMYWSNSKTLSQQVSLVS